jgi:hypothetical protein
VSRATAQPRPDQEQHEVDRQEPIIEESGHNMVGRNAFPTRLKSASMGETSTLRAQIPEEGRPGLATLSGGSAARAAAAAYHTQIGSQNSFRTGNLSRARGISDGGLSNLGASTSELGLGGAGFFPSKAHRENSRKYDPKRLFRPIRDCISGDSESGIGIEARQEPLAGYGVDDDEMVKRIGESLL